MESYKKNKKIKRSTAYGILRAGRAEKQSRGGPRSKVYDEIKNFAIEVLEQDPLITLAQLNEKIHREFPEKEAFSDAAISRAIGRLGFILKLVRQSDLTQL